RPMAGSSGALCAQKVSTQTDQLHGLYADLAFHGFEAGDPYARFFIALLRLLSFLSRQRFRLRLGPPSVAVMRFVVDDDDVLLSRQIAADPAHDLIGCFDERTRLAP